LKALSGAIMGISVQILKADNPPTGGSGSHHRLIYHAVLKPQRLGYRDCLKRPLEGDGCDKRRRQGWRHGELR
jgi:hypothetical protein